MSKRQAALQKEAQSQKREMAEKKWRARKAEKERDKAGGGSGGIGATGGGTGPFLHPSTQNATPRGADPRPFWPCAVAGAAMPQEVWHLTPG